MKRIFKILNELYDKEVVDNYAIGGTFAIILQSQPVLTDDIDIFVLVRHKSGKLLILDKVYRFFLDKGGRWGREEEGKQHIVIDGIKLDILPIASNLENEALENVKYIEYEGIEVQVFNLEYMIALKVNAGRPKDLTHIANIFEASDINKGRLKNILLKYKLYGRFTRYFGDL